MPLSPSVQRHEVLSYVLSPACPRQLDDRCPAGRASLSCPNEIALASVAALGQSARDQERRKRGCHEGGPSAGPPARRQVSRAFGHASACSPISFSSGLAYFAT